MGNWMNVLFQVIDFCVKGIVNYAQTEQGEKELSDITAAWEGQANTDDSGGSVEYHVEDVQSQAEAESSAPPPRVHFSPRKNV